MTLVVALSAVFIFVSITLIHDVLKNIEINLKRLAPGCSCPKKSGVWSSTCPAHKEHGPHV